MIKLKLSQKRFLKWYIHRINTHDEIKRFRGMLFKEYDSYEYDAYQYKIYKKSHKLINSYTDLESFLNTIISEGEYNKSWSDILNIIRYNYITIYAYSINRLDLLE